MEIARRCGINRLSVCAASCSLAEVSDFLCLSVYSSDHSVHKSGLHMDFSLPLILACSLHYNLLSNSVWYTSVCNRTHLFLHVLLYSWRLTLCWRLIRRLHWKCRSYHVCQFLLWSVWCHVQWPFITSMVTHHSRICCSVRSECHEQTVLLVNVNH